MGWCWGDGRSKERPKKHQTLAILGRAGQTGLDCGLRRNDGKGQSPHPNPLPTGEGVAVGDIYSLVATAMRRSPSPSNGSRAQVP